VPPGHGRVNYWGYQPVSFFAPHQAYSARQDPLGPIDEFRDMVKALHRAGIEVLLDVVYNHTGEGDQHGPTLSFRGIDNSVYYRLDPLDRRHYLNYAGTGNCLNTSHPAVLALVMDSLRYWVNEMHVDGFRFDLAVALTRDSAFLAAVQQDPALSQVKLIGEPWDLGPHGYRLGGFPPGWAEWNDKYRDTLRSWWRGDAGMIGALASRLAGSSDVFEGAGREPTASVNYVTAHDGFTLHDLVTYEHKQNQANLEGNRDGADDNRSWNAGELRARQKRNLLAALLFSQGVPMLLAGDELGRTQRGNNNAYCQDNELSWVDWDPAAEDRDLAGFVARLVALRREHAALRRRHYARPGEVRWLKPQGGEMSEEDWRSPFARCLGMLVPGEESLLLLLNAHHEPVAFALPSGEWSTILDTAGAGPVLQAHSLVLLKASSRGPARAGG
jgi:glycogen operon protein